MSTASKTRRKKEIKKFVPKVRQLFMQDGIFKLVHIVTWMPFSGETGIWTHNALSF